jgi:hypothetical protein
MPSAYIANKFHDSTLTRDGPASPPRRAKEMEEGGTGSIPLLGAAHAGLPSAAPHAQGEDLAVDELMRRKLLLEQQLRELEEQMGGGNNDGHDD